MLLTWLALVVVGMGLVAALLPSALTSEGDVTSNPDSKQARRLIDARLPDPDAVDEM